MMRLQDKVALATGGARGIGFAIARGHTDAGARVIGPAMFLASDQAEHVVARTLNVDGGNGMS